MRLFKHVLLPAITLLLVAMPLAESVLAEPVATPVTEQDSPPAESNHGSSRMQPQQEPPDMEASFDFPELVDPEVGDLYTFDVQITFSDPAATGTAIVDISQFGSDHEINPQASPGPVHDVAVSTYLTETDINMCIGGELFVRVHVNKYISNEGTWNLSVDSNVPCTSSPTSVYPDISLITQTKVCGPNNDEISFEQEGVTHTLDGWNNDENTIRFAPAEGYVFADGAVTSHLLTDEGDCITSIWTTIEDGAFQNVNVGDTVTVTISLTLEDGHSASALMATFYHDESWNGTFEWMNPDYGIGGTYSVDVPITLTEGTKSNVCDDGFITILPAVRSDPSSPYVYGTETTYPCSFQPDKTPVNPDISLITQTSVCGPNNDEITFEQEGVEYDVDPWSGNETTIHFNAAEGYVLADDAVTSHQLTDEGDCLTDTPDVPELRYAVCGPGNDIYSEPIQPEHVTMDDSGWIGTERTFTFTAADGYMLPDGFEPTHTVHDVETPCPGNTALEIEEDAFLNRIPGVDVPAGVSFTLEDGHPYVAVQYNIIQQDILLPSGPNNVDVEPGVGGTFSGSMDLDTWISDGEPLYCQNDADIKIHGYFAFYTEDPSQPNTDPQNTIVMEEYYPCSFATPLVPEGRPQQIEVCGPNNDTFIMPDYHEAISYTIGEYDENGFVYIELHAADGYYISDPERQVMMFTDDDTTCVIEGELNPPSIAEVCGPNNDVITPAATQPEGVDPNPVISDWADNEATLTYSRIDGQPLPEEFENVITVEDQNDPCLESVSIEVEEGAFLDRRIGVPVNIDVTFTLADAHPYDTIGILHMQDNVIYGEDARFYTTVEPGVGGSTTVTVPLVTADWAPSTISHHCPPWDQNIAINGTIRGVTDGIGDESNRLWLGREVFPCTYVAHAEPVIDITQVEVCGPNNDTFEIADQPEGVGYTINDWENGSTTIEFYSEEGYYFWGFLDVPESDLTFTDAGDPCLESIALDADDGAFMDVIPIFQVPMSATVSLDDTHTWEAVHLTLYRDRDTAPLGSYHHVFNVEPGDGGPHPVEIEYPGTPRGMEALTCVDGEIELELVARPYSVSEDRVIYTENISVTESFPCFFLTEVSPVMDITQVTVCGPNNDVFEIAAQPEGVGYEIYEWEDGSTTIEFYPEDDYYFWNIWETEFDFNDISTPCPTDAPAPPVQTQVCGPDNDELTIPPQPEGVTLENDSGWEDGARTVTFAVDPAFITEGETEFTFTDEDIACPIPTTDLTVQLIPSDGESIEGAPWQLYAPVAAQNVGTEPYAEGTVGAENSIMIEELIAGDYRLVVDADGYEPIDTVLTVEDGDGSQQVRLDVIALQPVETPTPEPTIEPTVEPTPEPTVEPTIEATPTQVPTDPTPAPTEETSPVTSLPETGSGSGGGFGILALAGLLAAMVLGVSWLTGKNRRMQI